MAYEIRNGGAFIATINKTEEDRGRKLGGERFDNLRALFGNVTKGCPCGRKKRQRHFESGYRALVLALDNEEREQLKKFFSEELPVRLTSDNIILLELK